MHQNVNYILNELEMRKHNALNACQQTLKSAGTSTVLNGSKPTEESMYPFNSSESMIFDLNSQQKQSVDNEWAQQLAEQLEESKKYFDDLNADALLQSVIERCKQAESLRALGSFYIIIFKWPSCLKFEPKRLVDSIDLISFGGHFGEVHILCGHQ